jgi:hypothetical protein
MKENRSLYETIYEMFQYKFFRINVRLASSITDMNSRQLVDTPGVIIEFVNTRQFWSFTDQVYILYSEVASKGGGGTF